MSVSGPVVETGGTGKSTAAGLLPGADTTGTDAGPVRAGGIGTTGTPPGVGRAPAPAAVVAVGFTVVAGVSIVGGVGVLKDGVGVLVGLAAEPGVGGVGGGTVLGGCGGAAIVEVSRTFTGVLVPGLAAVPAGVAVGIAGMAGEVAGAAAVGCGGAEVGRTTDRRVVSLEPGVDGFEAGPWF